jgi:hypothetical protein
MRTLWDILIKDFWEVFWVLLKRYFSYGWPFALAHLLVLYSILWHSWWKKIRVETNALSTWNPHQRNTQPKTGEENAGEERNRYASKMGETTRILDQFVEESEKLGPQGFFVPMTDFSDRLDSIVDGMVAELHDRTNLFLLVGIAGTLFGVFEFSFRSYATITSGTLQPSESVFKLGEFLSGSMAKAFPVGFMGLAFTFFAQIIATFPERKLLTVLAKATSKALQRRRDVSRSQAEIVHQSAIAIKEAMQPLADLKETLTQSVQPVVKEFGNRLDKSLELVRVQFQQLQGTTNSVHHAVESVQEGVASLEKVADSLKVLLHDAPKVLANMSQLQEQQKASLQEVDQILRERLIDAQQIHSTLTDAIGIFNALPKSMLDEWESGVLMLREDSLNSWKNMSDGFKDRLFLEYENLLRKVSTHAEEIKGSATETSEALQRMTASADSSFQKLVSLPDEMQSEMGKAFGDLGQKSYEAWQRMAEELGRTTQQEHFQRIDEIREQSVKTNESLKEAADNLGRVAQNADALLREPIKDIIIIATDEISEALRRLDQELGQRYPQVSQDILQFTERLSDLLSKTQQIQHELGVWLQDAKNAREIMRTSQEDANLLDLARNNVAQLKEATRYLSEIKANLPESGPGIRADMQESKRLLAQINSNTALMANKPGRANQNPVKKGFVSRSFSFLRRARKEDEFKDL